MFFKFIFKRKEKQIEPKSKSDINSWMNLTKAERLEIDSKQKDESMRRKKALLKSIREDYIKIKKQK